MAADAGRGRREAPRLFRSADLQRLHADPRRGVSRARHRLPVGARRPPRDRRQRAGDGVVMRGVRQIVRFNWPFYLVAALTVFAAAMLIGRLPLGTSVRAVLYTATALATFWIAGSLIASWIVYDRSDLMRWTWIGRALAHTPGAWINIHAGLDESTPALQAIFSGTRGRVFDIFDPVEMTESSIARARRRARPGVPPEIAGYRCLPVP